MSITISSKQLEKMQTDFRLETDEPNYHGMYDHIFKVYGAQMDAENGNKDQSYWFQQAAQVNEYLNDVDNVDPTQSAYFIQQINIESLKAA